MGHHRIVKYDQLMIMHLIIKSYKETSEFDNNSGIAF